MDIKHHFEVAWNLCLKNVVSLIIVTLVLAAISFISLGILAPIAFAGYAYALLLLINENREPRAQDIFSHLRLFFPLLGFLIIVFIICFIGYMLLVLPGVILSIGFGFCGLYMLPILVDKEIGVFEAFKKSVAMATQNNIVDHIIVFVIFSILTAVGSSSVIGFLILQPFATLFLLSVYEAEKQ